MLNALNLNNKCAKPVDPITKPPTPTPVIIEPNYGNVENGHYPADFDSEDGDLYVLDYERNMQEGEEKLIKSITIINTHNKDVGIQIPYGYDEITFDIDSKTNKKKFYISWN